VNRDTPTRAEPCGRVGIYIKRIVELNPQTFRIFSPDELTSNKLAACLEVTHRNFQWDPEASINTSSLSDAYQRRLPTMAAVSLRCSPSIPSRDGCKVTPLLAVMGCFRHTRGESWGRQSSPYGSSFLGIVQTMIEVRDSEMSRDPV
jgi:hypothetical protein